MPLKLYIFIFLNACVLISCKPKQKSSIEAADSANKANIDKRLNENKVVIDEASSTFLVRCDALVQAEIEAAQYTMHSGVDTRIKDFAAELYRELGAISDTINALAFRKQIILPSLTTVEKETRVSELKKHRGNKLDRTFIDYVKNTHEEYLKQCETAIAEVKDEDLREFADISSLIFKKYLKTSLTL